MLKDLEEKTKKRKEELNKMEALACEKIKHAFEVVLESVCVNEYTDENGELAEEKTSEIEVIIVAAFDEHEAFLRADELAEQRLSANHYDEVYSVLDLGEDPELHSKYLQDRFEQLELQGQTKFDFEVFAEKMNR